MKLVRQKIKIYFRWWRYLMFQEMCIPRLTNNELLSHKDEVKQIYVILKLSSRELDGVVIKAFKLAKSVRKG